jgi:hypothetical protein
LPQTQSLLKALALKARHISAMGEAHGLDIQGYSQVLDENTSIGKIRVRQNGSTVIFYQGFIDFLNRIVHIENIRLKLFANLSVFTYDLYWPNDVIIRGDTSGCGETLSITSAEGATYISHG